jgi:hypothetical protein
MAALPILLVESASPVASDAVLTFNALSFSKMHSRFHA